MACVEDGIVLLDSHGRTILENNSGRKFCQDLCECGHSPGRVRCPIHHLTKRVSGQTDPTLPETMEIEKNNVVYGLKFSPCGRDIGSGWTALRITSRTASGPAPAPSKTSSSVRLLSDLIAALAHEINNPLTPLLNAVMPAPSQETDSRYTADSLATIRKAGESIAGAVRRLMVFNDLVDRHPSSPTDLNAAVRSTVRTLKRAHDRGKIVVRSCLDRRLPDIIADPVQLRFFLENVAESILFEISREGESCFVRFLTNGTGNEIFLRIEYGFETERKAERFSSRPDPSPDSFRNLQNVLCELLAEVSHMRMERRRTKEGTGIVVIRFRRNRRIRRFPSA